MGDTKTLDVHVKRVRSKIEEDPAHPKYLTTVRGLGYKIDPGELKVGKKNVWVGTGTGALELTQVKAQGKKAMRAADWARGARLSPAACVR